MAEVDVFNSERNLSEMTGQHVSLSYYKEHRLRKDLASCQTTTKKKKTDFGDPLTLPLVPP